MQHFQPIQLNKSDLEWSEYQQHMRSRLCNVFAIPPEMIGEIKHTTYSYHAEYTDLALEQILHTIRRNALRRRSKRLQKWLHRVNPALERKWKHQQHKRYMHGTLHTAFRGIVRGV